jgi:hypothetical protein
VPNVREKIIEENHYYDTFAYVYFEKKIEKKEIRRNLKHPLKFSNPAQNAQNPFHQRKS